MMSVSPQLAKRFAEAEQRFFDGQLKEAADLCQEILAADPQFAHAYYLLGALFKTTGNFAKAIQFSDLAIQLVPDVANFHLQRGHSLMCMGNYTDAKPALEKAYHLDSKAAITALLLGDVYTRERKFDEAVTFFKKSLALEDIADTYEHMALCLHLKGDLPAAEAALLEVVKRNPNYAQGYVNLARVKVDMGDMAAAEKHFAKALSLNPQSTDALIAMAKIHEIHGDYAKAAELGMKAVQLKPDDISFCLFVGTLMIRLSRYDVAEQLFKRVLEKEPGHAFANQSYANMLIQLGKKEEALVYIEKTLEKKPNDEVMRYFRSAFRGENVETAPTVYVAKLFDEYAERFDQHLQDHLGYNTPNVLAGVLREILAKRSQGKTTQLSLLDLGCGTGLGAEAVKDFTEFRVGVDLSPKMVEKAKTKHVYQETAVGDIVAYMQQEKRAFDLVIAVDVLVYIGNLHPFFSAAKNILSGNGLLAFSVEADDDVPGFVLRSTARYAHSKQYLLSLAEEYGFDMTDIQPAVIRQDKDKPIKGYIAILQKK